MRTQMKLNASRNSTARLKENAGNCENTTNETILSWGIIDIDWDVPKSSHEAQAIYYRATGLTLTSKEESYDIENHGLTLIERKNELIQSSKKVQSATDLSTSEEKAMEISDKGMSNDVYTLKRKSKGNVWEMGKRSSLLNGRTSHTVNGLGTQKEISLLKRSLSLFQRKFR